MPTQKPKPAKHQKGTTDVPDRRPARQSESMIVVRDRRARYQFSVHNTVIDQWLPILGPIGFTLYSFYCRLANSADERCYPGYTLIQSHLGLGRSTISEYNKVLEWCDLILIQPGDRTRSNDYYLLDIPEVTPEKLKEIAHRIKTQLPASSRLRVTILERIEAWQPLQAHFADRTKPTTVTSEQLRLPGAGGSPVPEQGSPASEQGSPVPEQTGSLPELGSPPSGLEQSESNNPKATIRTNKPKTTTTTPSKNGNSSSSSGSSPNSEEKITLTPEAMSLIDLLDGCPHNRAEHAIASALGRGESLAQIEHQIMSWVLYAESPVGKGIDATAIFAASKVEKGERCPPFIYRRNEDDQRTGRAWRAWRHTNQNWLARIDQLEKIMEEDG